MWYQVGADLVVLVHLLFIGFVVGGVFLAWRWPRMIWAHIPAAIYGALVEFAGFSCPLTQLENDLRRHAGERGYKAGRQQGSVPPQAAEAGRHQRPNGY